ncbi:4Fe-4S binding protein [Thermodesulfobacteriota bacterium]
MVIVMILFGRVWCTICSLELVSRGSDFIARKIGYRRMRIGRWLRHGWAILLVYIVLQFFVAVLSIHRVPHYAALLPLALLLLPLVTGLIFNEPRAFCKIFCPAGALLSVYGRYTPVQIDIEDPELCKQCRTKDCAANRNRYKFDARSCPSLIPPFKRKQGDGCIDCFQCAKVCPYENVGFGVTPAESSSRVPRRLKPYEAVFVLIVAGFVTYEIAGEVKWVKHIFLAVPYHVEALLPPMNFGWLKAIWMLLVFPLIVWSLAGTCAFVLGYRGRMGDLAIDMATGSALVVAVMHLAKGLAKLSSWSLYLPLALKDPLGVETAKAIINKSLPQPGSIVSLEILGWIMIPSLMFAAWKSREWVTISCRENPRAARVGIFIPCVLYLAILLAWIGLY